MDKNKILDEEKKETYGYNTLDDDPTLFGIHVQEHF